MKVKLINDTGSPSNNPYWVRANKVVGVATIVIEGELSGPTGDPILTQRAGLDLGNKMLGVDSNPEEMVAALEAFDDV